MSEELYISTGEIRKPRKGETFLVDEGKKSQILNAIMDFQVLEFEIMRPISSTLLRVGL